MVHNGNAAAITAVNKKKGERLLMKIKKRFLGILLSLALMLGMMPGMSLTAYADTQSFLILRDSAFYNATGYANNGVWQGSNAQWWCTNYYTSNLKTNFAEYIDGVDKTDEEKTITQGSSTYSCASQEIKGSTGSENVDKVFFLSAAEYEQYKNTNDMILETGYGLRTVGNYGALSINANGKYSWANVQYANLSARPALYLKSTFFKAYKDDSGIRYWSSNASEPGYTESTNLASEFTNHTNKLKLNDDTYWTVLGYKKPTYTVTFNANGHGDAPANQDVASGGKITKPSDPTDQGYTFEGWYKEAECTNAWNFETDTVIADTTLYAKWIEITKYPIYVGGVQVTSANAGNITGAATPTASYDADSNTLTLKGASINTGYDSAGIYYKNDDTYNNPLNIILEGNNSIIGDGITTGIYGAGYYGSFTFSGDGSLNTSGTSSGILSYYGSVKIDNGTINASGTGSSGISAKGSITINGGNVEATGANYGITANNGVSITDGTVTAKATNSTSDTGSAIYSGGNGISITGGTVMATGTSSSGKAYGLFLGGSGSIKIGSEITSLTATGTTNASHGTVENRVAGMGWNTTDGTGDGTEIAVNTSGASLDTYKKLVFPYTKPAAIVITAPIPVSGLIYTGFAQELVTTGTASGGTMKYAVTMEKQEPLAEAYTFDNTSKPKATNAGTYYVWYKVVGNENYIDTEPVCVKVTIAEEKKQDEPVKPNEPDTPDTPAKTVDMYRIYNPNSGEHFYTANAAEKDNLVSLGWKYEGIGWKAPEKSDTPVYRLYNPNAGDHHYTTNKAERDNLISVGWKDEGIGWYSDDAKSVAIYRQYNPNAVSGAHNFTSNKGENDWLVSLGWKGEGIGWYGVK